MQVHLTQISRNTKTGPIPVSTTSADTCPATCPFKRQASGKPGGCYGDNYPMLYHWQAVTAGQRGGSWEHFCDEVSRLRKNQLWRHNQAGDLPGDGVRINAGQLMQLVKANRGRRGFTFTHYPMDDNNQALIYLANNSGFTVNLSANNLAQADQLAALEIAPVVVVLPEHTKKNTRTPAGRPVIICPATLFEGVNCDNCEMCQKVQHPIIGFPAHGSHKSLVNAIAGVAGG